MEGYLSDEASYNYLDVHVPYHGYSELHYDSHRKTSDPISLFTSVSVFLSPSSKG